MEQLTSWLFKYELITKTYTKIEDKDLFEAKYFLNKQHPDYLVIAELVDISPPPLYVLTTNDLDYVVVNSPDLVKTLDGLETDLKRYEYLEKNVRAPYVDNLFFLYNTRLGVNTQEEAPSDSSAVLLTLLLLVLATNSANSIIFNKPTNEIEKKIREMSGNDVFPDPNMEVLRGIFNITRLSDLCAKASNKSKEECETLLAFRSTELWLLTGEKTMYLCEADRLKPSKSTQKVLGNEITQITDDTEVLYWQTDGCVALDYENLEIIRQFKEYFGNELSTTPAGRLEYMPRYNVPAGSPPTGPPTQSPSPQPYYRETAKKTVDATNAQVDFAIKLYSDILKNDIYEVAHSVRIYDLNATIDAAMKLAIKHPKFVSGLFSGFAVTASNTYRGLALVGNAYSSRNEISKIIKKVTKEDNSMIQNINGMVQNAITTVTETVTKYDAKDGILGEFIVSCFSGAGIKWAFGKTMSIAKLVVSTLGVEVVVGAGALTAGAIALDYWFYLAYDDFNKAFGALNKFNDPNYWMRMFDETMASNQYKNYIKALGKQQKVLDDVSSAFGNKITPEPQPRDVPNKKNDTKEVQKKIKKTKKNIQEDKKQLNTSGTISYTPYSGTSTLNVVYTRNILTEPFKSSALDAAFTKFDIGAFMQNTNSYDLVMLAINKKPFVYDITKTTLTRMGLENDSNSFNYTFDHISKRLSEYITSRVNMTEQELINRHSWLELYVTAQNQIYEWSYSGNETLVNISLKDNYVKYIEYHDRAKILFGVGLGVGVAGGALYKYLSKDNSTEWNYAKHSRNPKAYKHLLESYVYNLVKNQSDYSEEDNETLQLFDKMKHSKNWFKPTGYTVDQLLGLIPEYKLGDFYVDDTWNYDEVIEYYKAICEACGLKWKAFQYFEIFLETKKGDTVYFTENDKKTLTSRYARIR
jgi:hypothetical protein